MTAVEPSLSIPPAHQFVLTLGQDPTFAGSVLMSFESMVGLMPLPMYSANEVPPLQLPAFSLLPVTVTLPAPAGIEMHRDQLPVPPWIWLRTISAMPRLCTSFAAEFAEEVPPVMMFPSMRAPAGSFGGPETV